MMVKLLQRPSSGFFRDMVVPPKASSSTANDTERLPRHHGLVMVELFNGKVVLSAGQSSGLTTIPRDAVTAETLNLLADGPRGGTVVPVHLRLPRDAYLCRIAKLPSASRSNLRKMVHFEVERQSPIDVSRVYFDHEVGNRDSGSGAAEVRIRIVRRDRLDSAIGLCRAAGLEPVSIGFLESDIPFCPDDLPLSRSAQLKALWHEWSRVALLVLIFMLAIGVVTAAFARREIATEDLAERLERARAASRDFEELNAKIRIAESRLKHLESEKQKPRIIDVIAELTKLLPDDSWLTQVQVLGKDVRVRGFSPSASALIARFDQSRLFAGAQFKSPLTQSQQPGFERFDLSLRIRGSGP